MLLSLVVPVYREEKNIPEFVRRITPILGGITQDYEIIFAMDPSPDRTEDVILEHRAKDARIKLLKFSRRFGQPMASLAGMQYSSGEAIIVMDVDMQDPPELVSDMVAKWQEGYDVVLPAAHPPDRRALDQELRRRNRLQGDQQDRRCADSAEYRRFPADVAPSGQRGRPASRKPWLSSGMVAVVGFKQYLLPFERPARFSGETNYNRFFGSLRIGFNGIFCFSTYALTLSTQFGFFIAGSSFLFALAYLVMKLCGFPFPVGNPTLVLLFLFLGGIQLISVGILGEYIGRIYEEVRARPRFIVDRAEGFVAARLLRSASIAISGKKSLRRVRLLGVPRAILGQCDSLNHFSFQALN